MTYYLEKSTYFTGLMTEGMNLEMVNSENRIETLLKPSISSVSKDKIFIDMGCGTGILGMYALATGAKFVYFVEMNPYMFELLTKVIPTKLNKNQFKLINKDIEHLTIEDFDCGIPDVAVSEFYGPTLFDEGYVNITKYVKSIFPKIYFIPEIFKIDFYLSNINYGDSSIWPNDSELLDFYKINYSDNGFNVNIEFQGDYVGNIIFNANTQIFDNSVSFLFEHDNDKLLIGSKIILHNDLKQEFGNFGWFIDKENKNKTFNISSDVSEYFQLIKKTY
jgi:SAM-dependent methyltransferase